jgi:hypothetical protein
MAGVTAYASTDTGDRTARHRVYRAKLFQETENAPLYSPDGPARAVSRADRLAFGAAPTYTNEEPTVLVVRNDSYLDHNIYLLQGSQRIRMGTARGLATTRFTIPRQYVFGVSTLQFLADPIGGNVSPVSVRIKVSPGDEVHLQIRGM